MVLFINAAHTIRVEKRFVPHAGEYLTVLQERKRPFRFLGLPGCWADHTYADDEAMVKSWCSHYQLVPVNEPEVVEATLPDYHDPLDAV